jgi:hypothetical protein
VASTDRYFGRAASSHGGFGAGSATRLVFGAVKPMTRKTGDATRCGLQRGMIDVFCITCTMCRIVFDICINRIVYRHNSVVKDRLDSSLYCSCMWFCTLWEIWSHPGLFLGISRKSQGLYQIVLGHLTGSMFKRYFHLVAALPDDRFRVKPTICLWMAITGSSIRPSNQLESKGRPGSPEVPRNSSSHVRSTGMISVKMRRKMKIPSELEVRPYFPAEQ